MSSALWPLTMVVLWLSYSLASTGNSRTDVKSGFSGPRNDRFLSDFQSNSMRRRGYKYIEDMGGYKYIPSGVTWAEARSICKKNGSDLAIINSEDEAVAILDFIGKYHTQENSLAPINVWIGNFIPTEDQGEWQTIFGDSLTEAGYNKWQRNPDDASYENCGTVLSDGQLNWSNCENNFGFVCEVPYVPMFVYKVFATPMTWGDAREVCREDGGDLVILNSYSEARTITAILGVAQMYYPEEKPDNRENIWIGVRNPSPGQGDWQTIYGDLLTEAGYEDWHEDAKNVSHGYCGGIFLEGQLTRWDCSLKLGFACEGPYINAYTPGSRPGYQLGMTEYVGPT